MAQVYISPQSGSSWQCRHSFRHQGTPVTLQYPTRCQSPTLPLTRPYPALLPWTPSSAVTPAFILSLPGHSTFCSNTIMPRFLDAIPLAGGNQVAGNDFAPSYVCKQGFQGALRRGDKYMAKGKYDKAIIRYESAMKHWFDETGSPGCYYVRDALNNSTATNKVGVVRPLCLSPQPHGPTEGASPSGHPIHFCIAMPLLFRAIKAHNSHPHPGRWPGTASRGPQGRWHVVRTRCLGPPGAAHDVHRVVRGWRR